MIPKTEIRYSNIYNRVFNHEFSKKDWFQLKKDCKEFEKLYKKYISQILKLIEKYHIKEWKYKFIPIYIVRDSPRSFSDPLTLKYKKNPKIMLTILAHELLHNNMGKKKFKNPKELHIYMEPILNKVILDLPFNLKKELKFVNKSIMKKYKR